MNEEINAVKDAFHRGEFDLEEFQRRCESIYVKHKGPVPNGHRFAIGVIEDTEGARLVMGVSQHGLVEPRRDLKFPMTDTMECGHPKEVWNKTDDQCDWCASMHHARHQAMVQCAKLVCPSCREDIPQKRITEDGVQRWRHDNGNGAPYYCVASDIWLALPRLDVGALDRVMKETVKFNAEDVRQAMRNLPKMTKL